MVRTIVTREAEWDDVEADKMQALAEYESGLCGCGLHKFVADEDPDLEMVERVCPVCAGLARNMRIIHATDDRTVAQVLGDKPEPSAQRPDDGRYMSYRRTMPTN